MVNISCKAPSRAVHGVCVGTGHPSAIIFWQNRSNKPFSPLHFENKGLNCHLLKMKLSNHIRFGHYTLKLAPTCQFLKSSPRGTIPRRESQYPECPWSWYTANQHLLWRWFISCTLQNLQSARPNPLTCLIQPLLSVYHYKHLQDKHPCSIWTHFAIPWTGAASPGTVNITKILLYSHIVSIVLYTVWNHWKERLCHRDLKVQTSKFFQVVHQGIMEFSPSFFFFFSLTFSINKNTIQTNEFSLWRPRQIIDSAFA